MAVIRYLVKDVDASIEFYAYLGFREKQRWGPPFAILNREDLDLWLSGPGTSAAKPLPDGAQPEPGGWNRLVLEVESMDGLISVMKQAGYNFRHEGVQGPGGRQVLVEDPSGNIVELFESGE